MNKKKQTKKEKKVEVKANPLEEMIKNCDEGIIITAKNGNIEITGIKNVNFAHTAKGLLVGALDSYTTRPVLNLINSYSKNVVAHITKAFDDFKKEVTEE